MCVIQCTLLLFNFCDFFGKTVKCRLHVSRWFQNLTLIPNMASDFMCDQRFSFKTEIGVKYWKFQTISEYLF